MSLKKLSLSLMSFGFILSIIFEFLFTAYTEQGRIIYKILGTIGFIIMLYDYINDKPKI